MRKPPFVVGMLSVAVMAISAGICPAQNYPNKSIRIVTAEAGGGSDFVARLVARGLSGSLSQQVIVDNRGGSAIIAAQIVSQAPPDGYTMLLAAGSFTIWPLLQKTPYDPVKDFSPITWSTRSPNILVVNPSVAAKSVKELIALAKAKPGTLNYATGPIGSSPHLAAELFKSMAGVNIVGVPYKGSSPAIIDLIAGQVQLMFATAASVAGHLKSGKLTALAVTSAEPSVLFPGVPTIAAAGVPGYESDQMTGAFAPARTPAAIIDKLNKEMVRVLDTSEVKQHLLNAGVEVVASSPQQLLMKVKAEIARMGKVIKDAGIRAD